jgi:hypothetical protein
LQAFFCRNIELNQPDKAKMSRSLVGKTLLALFLFDQFLYATANPMSSSQFDFIGGDEQPLPVLVQTSYGPDQATQPAQSDEGADLSYGRCYFITNPSEEHLGSEGPGWSYLKFGSRDQRRPFRVCKDKDSCSERGGSVGHRGKFWLQDFLGSHATTGRSLIAGNSPGQIYPAAAGYQNHLQFQAFKDCDNDDMTGKCYSRLKLVNEKSNNSGLEIDRNNCPITTKNKKHTISVAFHLVNCPEDYD